MIRNENEYREAVRRLEDQEARIQQQAAELRSMKLSKQERKRVTTSGIAAEDDRSLKIAGH